MSLHLQTHFKCLNMHYPIMFIILQNLCSIVIIQYCLISISSVFYTKKLKYGQGSTKVCVKFRNKTSLYSSGVPFFWLFCLSISVFSCGQYIFSLQVDTTIRCIVVEPAGNMYCNKKKKTLKTRVREHLSCDKNII